jgi:hypothetical protein
MECGSLLPLFKMLAKPFAALSAVMPMPDGRFEI